MYEKELEIAIELARTAGTAVLAHYSRDIVAESKIGADNFSEPVTIADREASMLVVEGLQRHFPDDGILSEEEDDDTRHRMARDRVWIIDPIDGTAGFIKKDGDFAVQIGLAVEGIPVVGVVLMPFHDVLYFASSGAGAFAVKGGGAQEAMSVSDQNDIGEMNLAMSRNHASKQMFRIVEELGFRKEVRRGSVGLKIGLIAEQVCDIYIHPSPRTKLWDTCAPQIILEEAGGVLTDLWGRRYSYDVRDVQNWGGIVASNGAAHDEVIRRLHPVLNEMGRHRILNKKAGN